MRIRLGLLPLCAACLCAQQDADWPVYHGSTANTKYSPLKQINVENVSRLRLAWSFDTGDAFEGSEMQCNPLIVRGTMYATSPKLRVFALDAASGKLKWAWDPNNGAKVTSKLRNRGLNYWESGSDRRLFVAIGPLLYALDAETGVPVVTFGKQGSIDLRENLGRDASDLTVGMTTPGIVYKDTLIIGSLVSEALPAAPGFIRAYDVRTGRMRWIFHTIPQPGEYGYETWPKTAYTYTGGVNDWSGMAFDEKRGLLFVPTGSAAFDFYGSNRIGDNLFANCLLALNAETGKRVWHFQLVHHDVWDRDLPTPPTLVQVTRDGRRIDAVAQPTKSGHLWMFERETGKPLVPYENVAVPPSDVDGEVLSKTQPLPSWPAPFARQQVTEEIITQRTPEAHEEVLKRLRTLRNGPQFTPPSLQGTVMFPGFDGGGEWGGGTYDPETGLFYVNANEMAWILRLVPASTGKTVTGKSLYLRTCASCHRADLSGSPPEFPALTNLAARRAPEQVTAIIRKGAGRMPGYPQMTGATVEAIVAFLTKGEDKEVVGAQTAANSPIDLKYRLDGYVRFSDPDGYPAVTPPWGTLNAIDLRTGEYAWKIPFGEFPELVEKGVRNTGSENYGGSVVTAGGLLFIGATNADRKMHAFDKRSGQLLWEYTMEAAGNATPATYSVNGRQFVVIAAGGGKWRNQSGGKYYAFALPE
jgi:quinoprotein glucose dehydrogenase